MLLASARLVLSSLWFLFASPPAPDLLCNAHWQHCSNASHIVAAAQLLMLSCNPRFSALHKDSFSLPYPSGLNDSTASHFPFGLGRTTSNCSYSNNAVGSKTSSTGSQLRASPAAVDAYLVYLIKKDSYSRSLKNRLALVKSLLQH